MNEPESSHEPVHQLLSLQHHPPVSEMSQKQLQELMAKLKALSDIPVPARHRPEYTVVVDLYSNARSLVYGVDPELTATGGDEAAIKKFIRFVRRPMSRDVYVIRLIKNLEAPDEECIAKASRSDGFAVVMKPEDE